MEEQAPKPWTRENARSKAIKYCLYQERCTQEVMDKLLTHKIYDPLRLEIIDFLIEERYLDDERYVNAVVRGKSNGLKWGESKIRNYLSTKRIPKSIIDQALNTLIDQDHKLAQLTNLIEKKIATLKTKLDFNAKNKINKAMLLKGYNQESIQKAWQKLNNIISE